MENIAAEFHRLPKARSQSWSVGLVFVILLHIAAIYALAVGLAVKFAKYVPPVLEAHIVAQPEKPPPEVPPPPQVQMTQPPPIAAVPQPDIKIETPQASPITTVVAPPSPPAPHPAIPDTAAAGVMSTHTIPPYPPDARRLSHEGTVRLQISITAEGAITNVTVAKSSGFQELDQTAADWVRSHWRYKPAIKDGQPVASTTLADVTFNLKDARF